MNKEESIQRREDLKKYKTRKGDQYNHTYVFSVLKDLAQHDVTHQSALKFRIKSSTIHNWRVKFKEEYALYKLLASMNKKKNLTKQELIEENQRLQKALEAALLKKRALDTLIDVAEEELNIDVRKKPGPRQSKG